MALGLLMALMSFVDIAYSANRNDIYEVLLDTSPTWDVKSDVWINANDPNPTVKIGESIVFSISSSDFAYYQLFVIDSKGSTTILVPDELDSSFFPTKRFVYPPLPDGCTFPLTDACIRGNNLIQQEGPVGKESVFMLATNRHVPGSVFGIEKGHDAVTVEGGLQGVKNALDSFKSYVARNNIKYTTEAYSYAVDSDTGFTTRALKSTFNSRLSEIKNAENQNRNAEAVSDGSGIANIFALNSSPEESNHVFDGSNIATSSSRPVVAAGSAVDTQNDSDSNRLAQNSSGSLTSIFDLNESKPGSGSGSGSTAENSTVAEPQVIVQEPAQNTRVFRQNSGQLSSMFDLKESNSTPVTAATTTQTNSTFSEPQVVVSDLPQNLGRTQESSSQLSSMFDLKASDSEGNTTGSVAAVVAEPDALQPDQISNSVAVSPELEDVAIAVIPKPKKSASKVLDESELIAEKDNRPNRKSTFEGLDLTDIDVMAYSRRSEPIVLSDVSFEEGSAVLGAKGKETLDGIGSELLDLQSEKKLPVILIVGHTDSVGPDQDNFILSVDRAKTAKGYLVETFDLPANRIISSGRGEFSPLVPNNSRENRARNRRVEISFLGQ